MAKDPARPDQRLGRGVAAADLERDHGPEAERHLSGRQLVLGVPLEARVVDRQDALVGRETHRQRTGVRVRALHPERQGLEASLDEPRRLRIGHAAQDGAGVPHRRERRLRPDDRAGEQVAVAADRLGGAVDDEIGAERERPLPDRRGERVVDDQPGPMAVRELGRPRHVDDAEQGVGGRLDVEEPRRAGECALPPRRLARIHERVRPADALASPAQELERAAVGLGERDDVLTALDVREEQGRDRGHARGEEERAVGPLEGREAGRRTRPPRA